MSHAYQEIVLDEDAKEYVTVNTHKGLYTYCRLPFGVSSSPAIFQRIMENILQGHRIDATGLHPVAEKVQAIQEAPTLKTLTELKAFLGLLNYYHRLLPNLSTILAPLHELLRKDREWKWGKEQEAAFKNAKALLQTSSVLVHYDASKELMLACDDSPYGRPIGFVSRKLNAAENNYSQLDKEGLAVIFGVRKFHSYLYGRKFTVVTDHKPLLTLFNELKGVRQMASPRIQRWAVTLRAYECTIVYKAGKDHSNADALSRLPIPVTEEHSRDEERVLLLDQMDMPLITARQVKKWTDRDKVIALVH
ncbi:hypothetical protein SRHO_G00182970 [Serrasalmus rhombeus]